MKRLFTFIFLLAGLTGLWAQGPAGQAFVVDYDQFVIDNARRYLTCGNDASLNPGNSITMEAWVRIHDSNWNQKIFGKLNSSFSSGYMLGVAQGKCYPEIWTPGNTQALEGFIPPLGHWHHFAVSATAGDSLKVYVNGVFEGGTPVPGTAISSNNDDLVIGIAPWDLANFQYFGFIDEVRIWNVERTAQEIKDHLFLDLDGSETGLVSYYSFNGAVANSPVMDESPNSNNCTFFNCDATNIADSYAVIGDTDMESQTDINGLWNGNGFTTPRVSLTSNGLSLVDTLTDWDYVVFGHDGGSGVSQMDLPAGAPASMERTGRIWYMNEVGMTSPNFSWNLTNAAGGGTALNSSLNANQYYLIYRSGTSGGFTVAGVADIKNGTTVIFNNVDMENGYYALATSPDPFVGLTPEFSFNRFLTVYPNPGTGRLKMVVETQLAELAQLQVFDLMGKRVFSKKFDGDISFHPQQLDLSHMSPGSYFLHLRAGDQVMVKEVMIQAQN